jgi:hypothetical protein
MSPANRANPDTTNVDEMFGWDVLAGYYTIEAIKSNCDSQTTPVLDVPPPVSNLELMLTCLSPPTRSATSSGPKGGSPGSEGSPALVSRRISVTPGRPAAAAVELRCVGGQLPCADTLTLTVSEKARKGKRKITKRETITTGPFSIAAGRTETLELELNPAGGALLRKARGQLRASLTLSAPSASPPGATTVGVLLIRQKPKPERH